MTGSKRVSGGTCSGVYLEAANWPTNQIWFPRMRHTVHSFCYLIFKIQEEPAFASECEMYTILLFFSLGSR